MPEKRERQKKTHTYSTVIFWNHFAERAICVQTNGHGANILLLLLLVGRVSTNSKLQLKYAMEKDTRST